MLLLALGGGALVGFSLGLTGGGGAIFAVPLLVYALGLPARAAVGVSLVTVGSASVVGLVQRAWRGQVEFATGLLFAVAGMLGAPLGTWLADRIPDALLLGLFAAVMVVVAVRMGLAAGTSAAELPLADDDAGPTCQRDPEGELRLTSRCAALLAAVGLGTGILAGLFGVGGGFIIVPALVLFSGMGMQRAIGTSLLVIALISAAGAGSHLLAGNELPLPLTGTFAAGSIAGLLAGSGVAHYLAGPTLQRVFAAAIVAVALFVLARSWGM